VKPISFENARPDLGECGEVLKDVINQPIDYNVVLMHCTPEFYSQHREEGKVNVGMTIWETTKLHPDWPRHINQNVDACIVGCEWNVDVFRDSGVTVPLFSVPHCVSFDKFNNAKPYEIAGIDKDACVFFWVGQWTERKAPQELVKAYWQAFQNDENVALVMKTYRSDYSDPEKNAVRSSVRRLKSFCKALKYPPIYLVLDMLSEEEMDGLFARGDCFVSLDHGEGFGMGQFQAGAAGKPIIVTGFGGTLEYAKSDNSYLVDYVEVPVFGMPYSPWYLVEQSWAQPGTSHAAELMRHVYNNREEASARGKKLQQYIFDNFSYEVIGVKLVNALKETLCRKK
jgi:glycosyltransferase involved in cell wall biosynthesis